MQVFILYTVICHVVLALFLIKSFQYQTWNCKTLIYNYMYHAVKKSLI